jgi:hypothetical protein
MKEIEKRKNVGNASSVFKHIRVSEKMCFKYFLITWTENSGHRAFSVVKDIVTIFSAIQT